MKYGFYFWREECVPAKMPLIALLFKAQIISSNLLVSYFFPVEIIHHGKIILSENDDEPANKFIWKKLNFHFMFFFTTSLQAPCVHVWISLKPVVALLGMKILTRIMANTPTTVEIWASFYGLAVTLWSWWLRAPAASRALFCWVQVEEWGWEKLLGSPEG